MTTCYTIWELFGAFVIALVTGGFIGRCVRLERCAGRVVRLRRGAWSSDADDQPRICAELVEGRPCVHLAVPGAHYCRQHIGAYL